MYKQAPDRTIEETFKHCIAEVKRNVEPLGVKVWFKYLGNCSVVMLYTTKQRPLGSDPVVIFGQFPEKGAKKAKGEGYFLYHRDTFLVDFNGKSDQQILSQTTKMFPNIQNLKRAPETSEPERLKRAKPAKFVKTAEDATQQIIEMGVQEMMLEVMLEVTALATKTVILQEQAEEEKNESFNTKSAQPILYDCSSLSCDTAPETDVSLSVQPHCCLVLDNVVSPDTYVVDFVRGFSSPEFSPTLLMNLNSEQSFEPDSPFEPRQLFYSPQQLAPVSFSAVESGYPNYETPNSVSYQPHQFSIPQHFSDCWQQQFPPQIPTFVHEPSQMQLQSQPEPTTIQSTSTLNPLLRFADYQRRHALKKVWGERNCEKKTLPSGNKGKPPKKVNVSVTTIQAPEFKHRKPCALFELVFKAKGEVCPSMMIQHVTEKSQYLCEVCRVILHDTCHTLYHQYVAEEKLDLKLCTQVFIPPPPKHA